MAISSVGVDDSGNLVSADDPAGSVDVTFTGTVTVPDGAVAGAAVNKGQLDALSGTYVAKGTNSLGSVSSGQYGLALIDEAASLGPIFSIDHYATGSQVYGMEFRNRPNARAGMVFHQYSNVEPALWIDNTDTNAAIQVKNTNNPTLNPGGAGSGQSATGSAFRLVNTTGSNLFQILGRGEILSTPGSDAAGHGIEVVGHAASTRRVLKTTMNGPQTGVEIVGAAGSAGFYPVLVTGYDYGPHYTTSQDGASRTVLQLTKNGTGAGIGLKITNKGTGQSIEVADNSATLFAVTAAGLPRWQAAATQQTTVGAAGGASALPATPTKYLKVVDSAGTTLVIPAYAAV